MWPPRGAVFKTTSWVDLLLLPMPAVLKEISHVGSLLQHQTLVRVPSTPSRARFQPKHVSPPALELLTSTKMAFSAPKQGAAVRHGGGARPPSPLVTLLLGG